MFDDASSPPVRDQVARLEPAAAPCASFATIARPATSSAAIGWCARRPRALVLLMDDDAALLGGEAVERARRKCSEADRSGRGRRLRPVRSAAAPGGTTRCSRHRAARPCYVPSFIGFAHLVRREVFVAIGGYRESFEFYGEEKDFCLGSSMPATGRSTCPTRS